VEKFDALKYKELSQFKASRAASSESTDELNFLLLKVSQLPISHARADVESIGTFSS
jgi:hypothetical protein